jgi:hypothetical protein
MKRAAILSGLLHVVILILMMVGIVDPFSRKLEDQRPLMIEFVDISDITKAPVLAPMDVAEPEEEMEALQQEPEPQPTPPPPPQPTPPPPPVKQPPQPAPMPEPKPLPPPPAPAPEQKPEPVKEPEPEPVPLPELEKEKPKPKPEEKKPEEKKPEPKPEEPKKPEKQKPPQKEKAEVNLKKEDPKPKVDQTQEKQEKEKVDTAFDTLLTAVEKETQKDQEKKEFDNLLTDVVKDSKKDSKKKDTAKTSGKTKGAPAEQVGEVVTASEIDAIRRLMQRCWIVPNGVRGVRNLQVKLKLSIAKDGTVQKAQIVDRGRLSDPVFRAAAESAERAIMDPNCNPLPLNPEKHQQWKTMTMTFDPADMQ